MIWENQQNAIFQSVKMLFHQYHVLFVHLLTSLEIICTENMEYIILILFEI